MLQSLIEIQREIYLAFADRIELFAETGGWVPFMAFLPMGIVFGAVHAVTPGHSKAVLAIYVTGSAAGLAKAILVSLVLSFTHVAISVVIALLSLPLVSVTLGSVGRAPLLEDISRGLLGLIGVWMLWQALRRPPHGHGKGEGSAMGFTAGLIPCPMTLFVMTFAISRGVPEAGIAFAVTMMAGVAATMSAVALIAVLFRQRVMLILATRPDVFAAGARVIGGAAGLILIGIAFQEIAR